MGEDQGSAIDGATIAAVAAAITALLFLWQLVIVQRDSKRTKTLLFRDLRDSWVALQQQLRIAIMLALGPDDYYTPVDPATRLQYRLLQERRALIDSVWSAAGQPGSAQDPQQIEQWARSDLGLQPDEALPPERMVEWLLGQGNVLREIEYQFELAAREVVVFLANLSALVVESKITVEMAYGLVGADLVRRTGSIRRLIAVTDSERRLFNDDAAALDFTVTEGSRGELSNWIVYMPGVERRVLTLFDLLWAHAAKTGELTRLELRSTAQHKAATQSGRRCRQRVRELCQLSGYPVRGMQLGWLLLWSEFPRGRHFERSIRGSGLAGFQRRFRAFSRLLPPAAPSQDTSWIESALPPNTPAELREFVAKLKDELDKRDRGDEDAFRAAEMLAVLCDTDLLRQAVREDAGEGGRGGELLQQALAIAEDNQV